MSLEELEGALRGLRQQRLAEPRRIDWDRVERQLGVRLPSDFVELSTFHGSVILDDFLSLLIPAPGQEADFVSDVQTLLSTLGGFHDSDMMDGYAPFPEPGGLLPWANSNEGDLLCWKTGDPDPDQWPVIVGDGLRDWEETPQTLTAFWQVSPTGRSHQTYSPAASPASTRW